MNPSFEESNISLEMKNGCTVSLFESSDWLWPTEVHLQDSTNPEEGKNSQPEKDLQDNCELELLYTVDENPPWYLAMGLGFQHYLTMFGTSLGIPFLLSVPLCYADKPIVISMIINTVLFASGLATLLQTTFGVRLPIVQGGTYALVAPTLGIMAAKGSCPSAAAVNATISGSSDAEWQIRMREVQGAIIGAGLFQVVLGLSGIMGLLIKYIGPMTIVPTISLVGLPLFESAYFFASAQWGITILMIFFMTLFSQVIKEFKVPFPAFSNGKCTFTRIPIFKLFPILLAIIITWSFSAILTASDVFPKGSRARTDGRLDALRQVPWIRVPYPGQWGTPIMKPAAVIGMLAGVLASVIESLGDYFACARLSGAPSPPHHALNRGICMEGIGCILTGAWGTGNGTTSYSENIGAIGITRVGSRRVVQFGALFMIVLAVIGKIGALFTMIPDPVIGGIFIVMFGMISAVGLSTLQFVDLNSMRNLFILGFSLFFGMVLPFWLKRNPNAINTGVTEINQIVTVLLSTNMAVGGISGFILDNLLPGTLEERGILKWRSLFSEEKSKNDKIASIHTYDLPFISKYLNKSKFVKYLPFLPYYGGEGHDQGRENSRKI